MMNNQKQLIANKFDIEKWFKEANEDFYFEKILEIEELWDYFNEAEKKDIKQKIETLFSFFFKISDDEVFYDEDDINLREVSDNFFYDLEDEEKFFKLKNFLENEIEYNFNFIVEQLPQYYYISKLNYFLNENEYSQNYFDLKEYIDFLNENLRLDGYDLNQLLEEDASFFDIENIKNKIKKEVKQFKNNKKVYSSMTSFTSYMIYKISKEVNISEEVLLTKIEENIQKRFNEQSYEYQYHKDLDEAKDAISEYLNLFDIKNFLNNSNDSFNFDFDFEFEEDEIELEVLIDTEDLKEFSKNNILNRIILKHLFEKFLSENKNTNPFVFFDEERFLEDTLFSIERDVSLELEYDKVIHFFDLKDKKEITQEFLTNIKNEFYKIHFPVKQYYYNENEIKNILLDKDSFIIKTLKEVFELPIYKEIINNIVNNDIITFIQDLPVQNSDLLKNKDEILEYIFQDKLNMKNKDIKTHIILNVLIKIIPKQSSLKLKDDIFNRITKEYLRIIEFKSKNNKHILSEKYSLNKFNLTFSEILKNYSNKDIIPNMKELQKIEEEHNVEISIINTFFNSLYHKFNNIYREYNNNSFSIDEFTEKINLEEIEFLLNNKRKDYVNNKDFINKLNHVYDLVRLKKVIENVKNDIDINFDI